MSISAGSTILAADFPSRSLGSASNSQGVVLGPIGKLHSSFFISNSTTTVFTSSGTWTRPNLCVRVKVRMVGGGGGGERSTSTSAAGAGGGAAAYAEKIIDVSNTSSVVITVGTGGIGGAGGGAGTGLASKFADASSSLYFTAGGGQGGQNTGDNPGTGGTASGGDVNISGGTGFAQPNVAGTVKARGGISFFGGDGGAPGAGGPGGVNTNGTAGADGIVIIEQFFY